MAKTSKYLVMSEKELALAWEPALQETLGICHTLAKAYEIALFLSGITEPAVSYRKALETIKAKGAVTINSKREEPAAVIVKVKIY